MREGRSSKTGAQNSVSVTRSLTGGLIKVSPTAQRRSSTTVTFSSRQDGSSTRNRTVSSSLSPKVQKRPTTASKPAVLDKLQARQRSASFGHNVYAERFKKSQMKESNEPVSHIGCSNVPPSTKSHQYLSHKIEVEQSQHGMVFDYIHGVIKHRPKTAFGSIIHDNIYEDTDAQLKPQADSESSTCHSDGSEDEETRPVTGAGDFLSQCILDSQVTVIKAAEKPSSSTLFSKLLNEFMLEPQQQEESFDSNSSPVTDQSYRIRANSLPCTAMLKLGKNSIACGTRVQIKLPEH